LRVSEIPVVVPDDIVATSLRIADVASAIVRERFRKPFEFESKSDASPVTEVDRLVEQRCRELLAQERPTDGVIGEEFGVERPQADWQWIVDPIDGTRAFMAGRPTFGTLIAVAYCGTPVLGIIDQPVVGDRWLGVSGRRSLLNGAETAVRKCAALTAAVLGTTSPELFAPKFTRHWQDLCDATSSRVYGGDCTAYASIASGWLDIVVEVGLKVYDFAALVPVLEGAGGKIADWTGKPLNLGSDGRVVAVGDPRLLAPAVSLLAARSRATG
jgi:inositol-phosphate phosphatase / L-galactose 1-phosphate phosphatase / histidinol-phosphatase